MRRLDGIMDVVVANCAGETLGELSLPRDLLRDGFRLAMHNAFPTWSCAMCVGRLHGSAGSIQYRMHETVDSLVDARMRNARGW